MNQPNQASAGPEQSYRNGAVICRQGEPHSYAYYIVAGYIKLTRLTPSGEEFAVVILPAGEIFGAPLADSKNASDGEVLQETAYAKGAVRLYRFRLDGYAGALPQLADPARQIIRSLSKRQSFLQRRLEHLLYRGVEDRIGAILLELITRYGGKCRHGYEIDIRITQQELAELVGASRSVVSTLLNTLRRRALISYTRDYICLHDKEALRRGAAATPENAD